MPVTLYAMCGPPESGKSTVARRLADTEGAVIVCPDTIRERFPRWQNPIIFLKAHHEARQALARGQDVVFDATNITAAWRGALIQAIKPYHPNIICIRMTTPLDQCLAWHRRRQAQGVRLTLNEQKLTALYFSLHHNPPLTSEGFHSIILVDPTALLPTPPP